MNLSKKQAKQIFDYYTVGGPRYAYCKFFGIADDVQDINADDVDRFLEDFFKSYNKHFGYTF